MRMAYCMSSVALEEAPPLALPALTPQLRLSYASAFVLPGAAAARAAHTLMTVATPSSNATVASRQSMDTWYSSPAHLGARAKGWEG